MKDRSLLLNTAIDSEFIIATSKWNQSLNAKGKKKNFCNSQFDNRMLVYCSS